METATRSVFFFYLFNFYSICLLIPFFVHFDSTTGKYYLTSHILHQIFCGCFHIYMLYLQISFLITTSISLEQNSAMLSGIFGFVMNASSLSLAIFSLKMLWFNKSQVLQVLECTRATLIHPKLVKMVLAFIFIFTTFWKFLVEIENSGGIVRFINLNQEVEQCYDRAWICSSSTLQQNTTTTKTQCTLRILTNLMSRVKILVTANIGGCYVFHHLTFLMLGLSMEAAGNELKRKLLLQDKHDVWKGTSLYRSLKIKVKILNQIYGSQLFFNYITILTYFTVATDILLGFKKKLLLDYVMHYTYLLINSSTWIICADYYASVQDIFNEWLDYHIFDNPKSYSFPLDVQIKIGAIKKEFDQGSLALSCKFFTISNGFLGQMLGVIVTYGIIIFQMQSSTKP